MDVIDIVVGDIVIVINVAFVFLFSVVVVAVVVIVVFHIKNKSHICPMQ